MPTNIQFGTDGWRAVIAETFTFDNVRLAAQASADYFLAARRGSPRLVVGYDTRFRSDRFARAVSEVLTANGIRLRPKGSQSRGRCFASRARLRMTAA